MVTSEAVAKAADSPVVRQAVKTTTDQSRRHAVGVIFGEVNKLAVDRLPMGASAEETQRVLRRNLEEVRERVKTGEVSCGIPILAAISLISSLISIIQAIVKWCRS